jgi:prepilin-type N-terminal cleavage/methylation domain-containing protein
VLHFKNNNTCATDKNRRHSERGFSLLEMVVAMVILTIGLLGVASAIGYSLMVSNRGRGVTNAKMLVVSILEQMETLRNTAELSFDDISNSPTPAPPSTWTGFPYDPATFRPVSTVPGSDGIFGTKDDLWGSCTSGCSDNMSLARAGVTRQIQIIDFPSNPYLKKIKVTLRYSAGDGKSRDLVGISYLNDDSHGTYVH